jgi:uncharacterized protein (TIGR02466 family)|tara:strand:+ start:571 stop:1185 length:615 start_codon:yes stop_codon:yes gene_type:complete
MIIDLFPTSIYMDSFELSPSDHANLSQVKLYRNVDEEAWVSDTNLHLQPWYQSIQGKIQTHVEKYIYDEMGLSKSYKMQCHGAWLNRNDKGDYTSIHHHSNSLISGVYYLAVQDTQGRIQFYDDKDGPFGRYFTVLNYTEQNNRNSHRANVECKNGTIVLFPSRLKHSVAPNLSEEPRFSLAFDYTIDGIFDAMVNRVNYVPVK